MCKNVDSVFIDESGKYDLHSDHVILSIQINDVHIPKKHSNGSNKFFWKIDEGTNWDVFQNNLKELFDEEWYKTEDNQLQRLHNKHRPRDSELGQNISDLYRKRKKLLHDAIKRKESHNKMKSFTDNCVSSKNKSKNFWNYLRDLGTSQALNILLTLQIKRNELKTTMI
jgi:vacuolar-type H+-ATPase catalytic subunit A/Vma1